MKKFLIISVFSFIYAVAVALLLDPNELAPGGVTGISILLNYVTPIPTGTWVFLLNIPLLLIAWKKFGLSFLLWTMYSLSIISVSTNVLGILPALTTDPLAATLSGAVLSGVSLGFIIRMRATTGGMDIVIRLLRRKYPHMKTGSLYLILDSIIIFAAMFIFKSIEKGIYAGIAVFVTSYIMDLVLYGKDEASLFFIVSNYANEVSNCLMKKLHVGVTILHGEGAYEKKEKKILLCATRKTQAPKLEQIVKEIDPSAFLIKTSANEIYGEGYKKYEELE